MVKKCRRSLWEPMMHNSMSAHQMRRARARAILRRALLQRGDEPRMVGQAEVIVAAKREIRLSVNYDMRRLRAVERAPLPQQALRGALIEFVLKLSEWHRFGRLG